MPLIMPEKDKTSARNLFEGEIKKIASMGPLARIEVDCGFPLLGVITKRSAEELSLKVSCRVHAGSKATAVHVIKMWS